MQPATWHLFKIWIPICRWLKYNKYDHSSYPYYGTADISYIDERQVCFKIVENLSLFSLASNVYFYAIINSVTRNSGSGSELDFISFDFSGKRRPSAANIRGKQGLLHFNYNQIIQAMVYAKGTFIWVKSKRKNTIWSSGHGLLQCTAT